MTVCYYCWDTHLVTVTNDYGEDATQMCTHCPTPCHKCREGGLGPYCETTPCDCECHKREPDGGEG